MDKVTLEIVEIQKPEGINFILGQSHFIKTLDDVYEALVASVPGIKFGFAFCEASGEKLIRWCGTDKNMIALAQKNMENISAGHSFILFLGVGFYPVNVLKTIQKVPEIVNTFCATANPAEVLVAVTAKGRGILGVIDGGAPGGIETAKDQETRKQLLKDLGYKA